MDELEEWINLNKFLDDIVEQRKQSKKQLLLVAIAGPAGSGKTTLAKQVAEKLCSQSWQVRVLSMDGFHHYRSTLDAMEDPVRAHKRRGAPFTFDVERFLDALCTLSELGSGEQSEQHLLWFPDFDHGAGDPRERAISIGCDTDIVVVEGLYLLLDDDRWRDAAKFFDCAAFLDVPIDTCERRLLERHMNAWHIDVAIAQRRVDGNDTPNNQLLLSKRVQFNRLVVLSN
jgi:pantothenate kinase